MANPVKRTVCEADVFGYGDGNRQILKGRCYIAVTHDSNAPWADIIHAAEGHAKATHDGDGLIFGRFGAMMDEDAINALSRRGLTIDDIPQTSVGDR